MSSESQIRANRLNGAKSRGPRTPEGKRRSSRNSRRHGMLSRTILLADEDSRAFFKVISQLEDTFRPQDAFEKACVESMAVARWRAMRIWAMEAATIQDEIDKQHNPGVNNPTRASRGFRTLVDCSGAAEVLGRYETRYERQFARAHNLLKQHRLLNEPNSEIEAESASDE